MKSKQEITKGPIGTDYAEIFMKSKVLTRNSTLTAAITSENLQDIRKRSKQEFDIINANVDVVKFEDLTTPEGVLHFINNLRDNGDSATICELYHSNRDNRLMMGAAVKERVLVALTREKPDGWEHEALGIIRELEKSGNRTGEIYAQKAKILRELDDIESAIVDIS